MRLCNGYCVCTLSPQNLSILWRTDSPGQYVVVAMPTLTVTRQLTGKPSRSTLKNIYDWGENFSLYTCMSSCGTDSQTPPGSCFSFIWDFFYLSLSLYRFRTQFGARSCHMGAVEYNLSPVQRGGRGLARGHAARRCWRTSEKHYKESEQPVCSWWPGSIRVQLSGQPDSAGSARCIKAPVGWRHRNTCS